MHSILVAIVCFWLVSTIVSSFSTVYNPQSIKGELCQIPFQYHNKFYHDCITLDSQTGRPWCFLDRHFTNWDYCKPWPIELQKCQLAPPNISLAEVEEILQEHNWYRGEMPAKRMRKLTWNSELAQLAQNTANKCQNIHRDFTLCGNRSAMGQNLYYNYHDEEYPNLMSWAFIIQQWVREIEFYNMNNATCQPSRICGHFTQATWDSSFIIGCGKAFCYGELLGHTRYSIQYYCNYYEAGNVPSRAPFIESNDNKCQDCHLFDDEARFRCGSDHLCETCSKDQQGCIGTAEIEAMVKNGSLCADIDKNCQMNKPICKAVKEGNKIPQLVEYTKKCMLTCELCQQVTSTTTLRTTSRSTTTLRTTSTYSTTPKKSVLTTLVSNPYLALFLAINWIYYVD